MNLGLYSYISASLGYAFLAVLLLSGGVRKAQGRLLLLAVVTTLAWAAVCASVADDVNQAARAYATLEVLRYVAWYLFLFRMLAPVATPATAPAMLRGRGLYLSAGFALLLLAMELGVLQFAPGTVSAQLQPWRLAGHLLLAVTGLVVIEQLFRNLATEYRHALKFLVIGTGVIFAFDFYLYADALLFTGVDRDLWEARGFVNLLAVPLLTIAAARNKEWSPNIFVSRDIVFHTTTIVGAGLYLLVMAAAGLYLQEYGGSWGRVAQAVFLTLAIIFLLVVLFSGQLRRQLRVFLAKHFYRNKYDYRLEWLNLTSELNDKVRSTASLEAAIVVLGRIVDARAGQLWLADGQGKYRNVAAWQAPLLDRSVREDDALVRFLAEKSFVINLLDIKTRPEEYGNLELPLWLGTIERAWLVVPLPGFDTMPGFVVLARPLTVRELNWEDRDLLKTAARQVASHLAVLMTSDALAQSRQFEVFNRLSSYMVHDLKNIAAGLEMVAHNADTHRDNPEFIDDAFDSVRTAAADIRRLLEQLRNKRIDNERKVLVDFGELLSGVAAKLSHRRPLPEVILPDGECRVIVERQRLENVLTHLVENAQQATGAEGFVRVELESDTGSCIVHIRDNGHGMDAAFIRERLFKPFDTTKGNAGMGIGMYESREFIRMLGGDIHVRSTPGQGTDIRVEIPAATAGSTSEDTGMGTGEASSHGQRR